MPGVLTKPLAKHGRWTNYLRRLREPQRRHHVALIDDQGSLTYHQLLVQLESLGPEESDPIRIEVSRNRNSVLQLFSAWQSELSAILLSSDSEEQERQLLSFGTGEISQPPRSGVQEQLLLLATSGSTGQPKWISHGVDCFLEKYLLASKPYVTYSAISIDHIGGLDVLLSCLAAGGTFVMTENPAPSAIAETIRVNNVAMVAGTPSWLKWLKLGNLDGGDLDSVELISFGGEPLDDLSVILARDYLPKARVIQKYGSTELGVLKGRTNPNDPREISFDPAVKHRIQGGLLEVFRTSQHGQSEISVKEEGNWIKTGDRAEKKGGWIRIVGRSEDEIISGGEAISVSLIKAVMQESDLVVDCHVYGEKNMLLGQVVGVDLVIISGADQDKAMIDVQSHCRSKLPGSHQPARLRIVSQLQHSVRFKRQSR